MCHETFSFCNKTNEIDVTADVSTTKLFIMIYRYFTAILPHTLVTTSSNVQFVKANSKS